MNIRYRFNDKPTVKYNKLLVFTNNEKIDMSFVFIECNQNSNTAARMYLEKYPDQSQPIQTYFHKLECNLRKHSLFQKPNKEMPRPILGIEECIRTMLEYVQRNFHALVQPISRKSGI